jgi:enoyl-[acyl-carrier protein] reductase II
MFFETPITQLFKIKYPIIQAGMIWVSGYKLAAAVSNAGGLGVIGAGSMYPNVLREHIVKCKQQTPYPFAVNLPLLYPNIDEHIDIIIEQKVPIVFTSAGNPNTFTQLLKQRGITVVHVVSSTKFALKAQQAGCHAVVAEGFEAGGHNGRDETTTLVLVPAVCKAVNIPVIAAGGIATGQQVLACMSLGASAVQIGSLFVNATESSAHINFKNKISAAAEGDTKLMLKKLTPVRLLKNNFFNELEQAENEGATAEELQTILGRARAKKGMFEGDMENGELEIGQASALINNIKSTQQIFADLFVEWNLALQNIQSLLSAKKGA